MLLNTGLSDYTFLVTSRCSYDLSGTPGCHGDQVKTRRRTSSKEQADVIDYVRRSFLSRCADAAAATCWRRWRRDHPRRSTPFFRRSLRQQSRRTRCQLTRQARGLLVKPKFQYADFPETCPRVSFGVSNHHDMSIWFEKFPRQVGMKPVCVFADFPVSTRNGKSATSATRHGKVSDVADKSAGTSRVCRGLVADIA